ncbi:hypothetical protein TanjilG_17114 [Lupinus angustifolius]|uniref:C2H2-type domain-containing protein n=1 Tax=Lupinus angustifolius TaxID=3871 RepID=A0A4P1R0P1_LUPAN|nr:PREDICTED: zinc finger protein ZAT5-like [Lupinus angustifolius]OIV99304.1 hypothetical protein TanjilG_17114 [Lupinus angustifolius]
MEKEQGLGREENLVVMAKGKRTKRLRLLSPDCGGATAATCTHSSVNSEGSSSTTTYESTDQEDQDMANCLILLARGGGGNSHHHHDHLKKSHDHDGSGNNNKIEKGRSSGTSAGKFEEMATAINITKTDFFIYECKTCNRTFPSFQALGGHRAGHKKPKFVFPEEKKTLSQLQPQPQSHVLTNNDNFEEAGKPHIKTTLPISFQLENQANRSIFNTNKAKIHECSICGSEFTSGQALGGHMRRHRAATNTTTTQALAAVKAEVQHQRNILELDLNLPAPEEDLRESKFQFPATQKSIVLSASPALVDCHY